MSDLNSEKIWVVGQYLGRYIWELQGVFTEKKKALDACLNQNYFIIEVPLNHPLPDETIEYEPEYPKIDKGKPCNPESCKCSRCERVRQMYPGVFD